MKSVKNQTTGTPTPTARPEGPAESGSPRWHLLYALLAAFDVLTVTASLSLNHRLVDIHTESLRVAGLLAEVGHSAGVANAPGNDVFDTHDVTGERRRLDLGRAQFEVSLQKMNAHCPGYEAEFAEIRTAMAAMESEAELIFHAFESNEPERAGERMATMDRRYAEVNAAVAELGLRVRLAQLAQSESLARLEYLIGGSVALMVMLALFYGHRLHVRVRATEEERQRHLTQLATSEEQFRRLVESTHTIPFELDPRALRFCYVAPQATGLLGVPASNWLDDGFLSQRMHPDDRDACLGVLARAGSEHVESECRLRRSDGAWIWARMILSVAGDEAASRGRARGSILRGVLLDVTETRRLEAELRQAQKLESVGRLAAGVAHEINTPVQFVSDSVHFVRDAFGDLSSLMKSYGELRTAAASGSASPELVADVAEAEDAADVPYLLENVPKALERSLEGLDRVATIVRSMKEFAHPDQKEMAPVDLNQAIQSTLTIARNEYKYVAEVETDFGELPRVTCLVGEVNQVVLNIVVNAAHAIADAVKGTDARGRITVRTRREGDQVQIAISDTGGGIPEHVRERIFDPFFTTKEVGRGTGQGLAIARAVVVEKHHGSLTFESEVGRGTTFFVRLPIDGARPETSALQEAAA
jgi:PAS domain S-box-containing protein